MSLGKYDEAEIPCLDSVANSIHADLYGDLKYYGNKLIW
jgi:hypothetical protein